MNRLMNGASEIEPSLIDESMTVVGPTYNHCHQVNGG
jgi:hypothetical protein